jgi:transketolase
VRAVTAGPSPAAAYVDAVSRVGLRDLSLVALEVGGGSAAAFGFASQAPDRAVDLPAELPRVLSALAERSRGTGPVFLRAPIPFLVEEAFLPLVRAMGVPRANVKLVGDPGPTGVRAAPLRDALGAMRSVPGTAVVAPADGPSCGAAVAALAGHQGPAYLELPPPDAPEVVGPRFAVGRAEELRSGNDLAIAAYGRTLAGAVALADDLARVGVSSRVLDLASLKPIDEPALLRAARDTGAILVVEAAPLATGIGASVAAITAENYPVPVRRLGLPELLPADGTTPDEAAASLAPERLRDEAWELLRRRGKVQ